MVTSGLLGGLKGVGISQLNATIPWLLCSLIHKFGSSEEAATEGDGRNH
jgi:hypothetical protein